jgi:2-polyprenyl-6-methoxyphenol hydroxylase-like FAD-dependent oxidoreductase
MPSKTVCGRRAGGVQAVNSKTTVLFVGGGPVGLALAVELGWRGIACTLVEQTDGTIATPKMNEVNVRTMEFCRRWGIADAVQNCPFPADYPVDVVFVTNLAGYELGRVPRAVRNSAQPEPFSPARFQVCSQIWFDPILRNFARSLPTVTLLYRHRLQSFEQSATGVAAAIVDLSTGANKRIETDYLVGCDGTNSSVREALGIELAGAGTIGHPVHMVLPHAEPVGALRASARHFLLSGRPRGRVGQPARHRPGERALASDGR